jgi:hypothetical protein
MKEVEDEFKRLLLAVMPLIDFDSMTKSHRMEKLEAQDESMGPPPTPRPRNAPQRSCPKPSLPSWFSSGS